MLLIVFFITSLIWSSELKRVSSAIPRYFWSKTLKTRVFEKQRKIDWSYYHVIVLDAFFLFILKTISWDYFRPQFFDTLFIVRRAYALIKR